MARTRLSSVRNGIIAATALALSVLPPLVPAQGQVPLAPGWGALQYTLPEPGSYALPVIGPARDAAVLDINGDTRRLHDIFRGRITLFSFIYSTCNDINGCPLATAVLHQVKQRITDDPRLRDNLRLVSLSFDPVSERLATQTRKLSALLDAEGTLLRLHPELGWEYAPNVSQTAMDPSIRLRAASAAVPDQKSCANPPE